LSASAIDVDSGDNATSNDDVEALNGLRAFLDTAGPVQHALAGVHAPFAFGDDFAARVRDSLAFYTAQLTGQILPNYADASHSTDAALRVLDALLRQPFMQSPTGRTLDADENAGADLTWDTGRLDDALELYKQFQAFTAHGLDPMSDGLRTRVRRLATVQVAAAMTDAIADAAHPQAPTTVLSDGDRDLTARVTAFEQSAPRILQLLGVLDELGATATYDALADLSTLNANALLARVDGSLDLANRYRLPARAVATWNGHAPFSATAFGSRPGALDDFLTGEVDAFRSSAQLARPLVGFLESQSGGTTGRTQSLKTWDVILGAVDHADKKPSTGPLVTIDAMVRTELDSIDVKSCSHQAPRSTVGGDLFAQRSDAMWSAVWRRCIDVASTGLTSAYARLSLAFRAKLAGRFPFSAPDAIGDAAPADVVDVLRDYDAFMAVARESASPDEPFGLLSGRADAFLTDLAQVRAFFAPLVDSAATGRPPTLDYQIDFRVNRAREVGANQIADWTADVADQHLTIAGAVAARRGRWRAGDDVQVALRWATGSPVVPVESAPPGGTVNDGTVIIQTHGEWSLLRLLRQYESDIADPDGGQTVKIGARTARRGVQGAAATTVATPTRAFLRVRLFNPDTKAEMRFPHFPTTAPDLAAEDRR
jgi:type VI secretion system protein ImpL